jgi:hypothetical protein
MRLIIRISFFLLNLFKEIKKLKLSKEEIQLKLDFKKISRKFNKTKKRDNNFLIPVYDDFEIIKKCFNIIEIISNSNPVNLKYFHIYTAVDDNEYYKTTNFFKKKYYFFKNYLKRTKILNILSINKKDIIGSNFQNFKLQKRVIKILNKNDILKIQENNVLIGDLIYDHYLRFYQMPTVNLNDKQLYILIDYAKNLVNYWMIHLNSNNINTIFLPYTAYLHWGVISRVAIHKNIKVVNFVSNLFILQSLDKNHQYHTKNYHLYDILWRTLLHKDEKINFAKFNLNNRLNGKIDDIFYMKKSAYDNNESIFLNKINNKNAIIFLHCFFDSPHIYGFGLFPDFFEWFDYILKRASNNKSVNYYVKPHPNGLEGNDEIVQQFKYKYKNFENIIFLDKNISNLEIIKFKPNAIFTFYGTVAHEFAYLKFPVILAGDSPMKNFKFCYQPNNINEFCYYINEVGNYSLPSDYDEDDLLSFYYMHYNYYSKNYNSENFNLTKNFNDDNFNIPVDVDLINLYFN